MSKQPHTLVVGVDFTRPGDVALMEAVRLASLGAVTALHLVYVVDPRDLPQSRHSTIMQEEDLVLERAPDHLRLRLKDVVMSMGVDIQDVGTFLHVRLGEHATSLHQVAVDYNADLIIVGSNDRGLWERLMLGSVSDKLVRTARCPVLVARPVRFDDLTKTPIPDAPYAPGQQPKYVEPHDQPQHVSSQQVNWTSSDYEGPTGIRIV